MGVRLTARPSRARDIGGARSWVKGKCQTLAPGEIATSGAARDGCSVRERDTDDRCCPSWLVDGRSGGGALGSRRDAVGSCKRETQEASSQRIHTRVPIGASAGRSEGVSEAGRPAAGVEVRDGGDAVESLPQGKLSQRPGQRPCDSTRRAGGFNALFR